MTHFPLSMQGTYSQICLALVSNKDERSCRWADDEERLFEPRIEASEISQIGKMLAITINDNVGDFELFHSGSQVGDSRFKLSNRRTRRTSRHTEFGPVDFDQAMFPRSGSHTGSHPFA